MTDREEFLEIFRTHITRPGSEKLLDWTSAPHAPYTVSDETFVKLRDLVMALPDFDDIPDRGGEKVLEAIQGLWIEEAD